MTLWAALAGALTAALPLSALAETICDPENPAGCGEAQGAETICDPEDPAGCEARAASAPELVCDPENPAGCGEARDAETICDPENPAGCGAVSAVPPNASALTAPSLPSWTGRVRAQAGLWGALDARWDEAQDVAEAGLAADLEIGARRGAAWSAQARGALRAWYGAPRAGTEEGAALLDVRLDESFLQRRWDRWSVRAGALVFPWSVTLVERPAASINRQERRALARVPPGRSDRDLPQPGVEIGWSDGSSFAELALIPFFVPDEVTFVGRDVGIIPLRLGADARSESGALESINDALSRLGAPDEVPSSVILAGRAGATLAGVDLSAGAYVGWDRTPYVRLGDELALLVEAGLERGRSGAPLDLVDLAADRPDLAPALATLAARAAAGETVVEVTPKRRVEGFATAETYLGAWGVRGEASASPAATAFTESLSGARRPRAAWSVGVSREGGGEGASWVAVVEGFGAHLAGEDSALTRLFVPRAERGIGETIAITGRDLVGAGALGSVRLRPSGFEFGAALRAHVSSGERFSEVYASAPMGDAARAWLGASWASGPALERRWTLGGAFEENDAVFFGLSGAF